MTEMVRERGRWGRIRPQLLVWVYTAALGAGALLLWHLALHGTVVADAPLRIPWPILALGFAAGHFAGIRLESRGHTHNIDLTDVVLAPAMVFAGPGPVIVAAVVGTLVRSLWVRRPVIRSAFNMGLHGFAVAAGLEVFSSLLGHHAVLSPLGGLSAVAGIFTAEVVTHVGIQGVIALSTRKIALENLSQLGLSVLLEVGVSTAFGLAAVYMLWSGWGGGVLFVILAATAGIGYTALGRLRSRHAYLDQLYRFERAMTGLAETKEVAGAVLHEALELFNAEIAQLLCSDGDTDVCYQLRSLDKTTEVLHEASAIADLARRRQEPVLASKGATDPQLAEALQACGFRDAMAVLLPTEQRAQWVLLTANRAGASHLSFDHDDLVLAQALTTPTAMALQSADLLEQLHTQVALEQHQASHDGLTGLANRALFATAVDDALAKRAVSTVVGVLIIDLDGFKRLNDSLGHESGDLALQAFSERLLNAIGDAGTAGRLGGDEFAVVLPHAGSPQAVTAIAQKIDRDVRVPARVGGAMVQLRASIGVAIAPFHGEDRFTLLRQADLAMYQAKQAGGGVQVQSDRHSERIDRPSLITALREAVTTSELRLAYQPTVDFATGNVEGVEALTRWTHPLYGVIGPDQFIPVAEASGLIGPLTRWLIDSALSQAATWRQSGFDLNMSVNLSPEQVDDLDLLTHIGQLLERHGLPPSSLTLEITETAALGKRRPETSHLLGPLANLGVGVSLDDFGVGTSSLVRLKSLPIDQLKIDKSFTARLSVDPTDHAIVASTIDLGHNLGLQVTAEGIETADTYHLLRALGCDIAQGYLISAPLEAADLTRWLYDHTSAETSQSRARVGPQPGPAHQPHWAVPTPAVVLRPEAPRDTTTRHHSIDR